MVSQTDIDLSATDAKTAIRQMIAAAGLRSVAQLAGMMEVKETTLRMAINDNRLRMPEFVKIADLCGFKIIVRNGGDSL